ncbi:MAG: hypothetical protein ACUVQN_06115 [Caldisericia bacterium]
MIRGELNIKGGVLPFNVKIKEYLSEGVNLIIDYMAKLIRYDEIEDIEYILWFDTVKEKKFLMRTLLVYRGFICYKIYDDKIILNLDKEVATQPGRFLNYFILVSNAVNKRRFKFKDDNVLSEKNYDDWLKLI